MELGQRVLGRTGNERVTVQAAREHARRLEGARARVIGRADRATDIGARERVGHRDTTLAGHDIDLDDLARSVSRGEGCKHRVGHHKVGLQTGRQADVGLQAMCAGSARKHGETQPIGQTRELFCRFHRIELLTILVLVDLLIYTKANGTLNAADALSQ